MAIANVALQTHPSQGGEVTIGVGTVRTEEEKATLEHLPGIVVHRELSVKVLHGRKVVALIWLWRLRSND